MLLVVVSNILCEWVVVPVVVLVVVVPLVVVRLTLWVPEVGLVLLVLASVVEE